MSVIASAQITVSLVAEVDSVWRYYLLQESTLSAPQKPGARPPAGWSDTEPAYQDGSTNSLYTVDLTVFSDGSWAYSEPSLSSSYEAAKAAYNEAKAAMGAAESAAKTATDYIAATDEGVVVGDMRGEELGFNSLQGADGFHVRNGGTPLASFKADCIDLGNESDTSAINLCGGKGVVQLEEPLYPKDETDRCLAINSDFLSLYGHHNVRVWSEAEGYADEADPSTRYVRQANIHVTSNTANVMRDICQVGFIAHELTPYIEDDGSVPYWIGQSGQLYVTYKEIYGEASNINLIGNSGVKIDVDDGGIEFGGTERMQSTMPLRGHYMCATASSDLSLSTSAKKVPMAMTNYAYGTLLKINNGGIKCVINGAVMVHAILYGNNMTAGNALGLNIVKTGADGTSTTYSLVTSNTGARIYTTAHYSRTMLVTAGDTIYLYACNINAAVGNVYASRTHLTVQYC